MLMNNNKSKVIASKKRTTTYFPKIVTAFRSIKNNKKKRKFQISAEGWSCGIPYSAFVGGGGCVFFLSFFHSFFFL